MMRKQRCCEKHALWQLILARQMMGVSWGVAAREGTTMIAGMGEELYKDVLCAVVAREGMTMTTYENDESYDDDLGGWVGPPRVWIWPLYRPMKTMRIWGI